MTTRIMEALAAAIREETEADDAVINAETTAADVPGWDSMAHVRIIMNAEQRLGHRFDIDKTYDASNVGELAAVLEAQIAEA